MALSMSKVARSTVLPARYQHFFRVEAWAAHASVDSLYGNQLVPMLLEHVRKLVDEPTAVIWANLGTPRRLESLGSSLYGQIDVLS